MSITNFYLSVLNSLNKCNVEYMLVGGHAVNFYGYTRSTLDMDLWVDTTASNLIKLENALNDLDYSPESCHNAILHFNNEHMFKIPKDNSVIDIMDSFMMKQSFSDSFKNRKCVDVDGVSIWVIGIDDLISCKLKSNRTKDLLDVQELKSLKQLQNKQSIKDDLFTGLSKKIKNQPDSGK